MSAKQPNCALSTISLAPTPPRTAAYNPSCLPCPAFGLLELCLHGGQMVDTLKHVASVPRLIMSVADSSQTAISGG